MPVDSHSCQFCGRETTDPVTDSSGFCSTGCRDAAHALEANDTDREDVTTVDADVEAGPDAGGPGERAFFHAAGMHSVTCEAFLERVATETDGVYDADASYVTETVSVAYDPETVSTTELRDRLSVAGYRVLNREETSGDSTAAARADGQNRELDDLLGFRYAAGVVFGVFVMLPYVVVFYPAQFALLQNSLFEGGLSGSGGFLLVPLFVVPTAVVVLFTGLPLLRGAYVSLRLRRPNTDLLATLTVVVAFVYGTTALLAGRVDLYFDLAIVVAAATVAAVFYESLVKQRAMDRLTDLTVSQASEARVDLPSGVETVPVDDLRPGDRVVVRQGERVPVDGELAEGRCTVDESVVTGESRPVTKTAGDDLVGGAVVTGDAAVVRVGDPPTSSIDRITTAVWLLQSATHGLQRRTDRLAALVVPAVLGLAVVAAAVSLAVGHGPFAAALAGLAFVLAGSPWGLALATPLSVATNLRDAMAHGVVVFDETVFERLRETDTVVLDKTGTLTTGEMRVVDADAPERALDAAAVLERRAAHPAGEAIVRFADARTDGGDDQVEEFESHAWGVQGTVDGTDCLVGHPALFAERGWPVDDDIDERVQAVREDGQLPVVVGRAGRATGVVVLDDEPREGWDGVLERLDEAGTEVVVLTGDDAEATRAFRDHPAVDRALAGIPPEGKTETVRRLQAEGHVTMVGDGTNDAPALAQSDLGIALGSGTALASDAADVAIADDNLETVETTFDLARAAGRRVRQNTGLALVYNLVAVPAAVAGVLNPVIAMAGVAATGGLLAANTNRSLLSTESSE